MKVVLDVVQKKKLQNGDILVYEDGHLVNVSKSNFLDEIIREYVELKHENIRLNEEMKNLKDGVNAKLEQYHNILQTLVKEN